MFNSLYYHQNCYELRQQYSFPFLVYNSISCCAALHSPQLHSPQQHSILVLVSQAQSAAYAQLYAASLCSIRSIGLSMYIRNNTPVVLPSFQSPFVIPHSLEHVVLVSCKPALILSLQLKTHKQQPAITTSNLMYFSHSLVVSNSLYYLST